MMSRDGRMRPSSGYSSYGYTPIKGVEREINNLKHENNVVYEPIIKNYNDALSRVTYEEEKQIQFVGRLENALISLIKDKFRVLKNTISATYSEAHKSLKRKRENVIRKQRHLKEFCRRNMDRCKRDPHNFDENEFLREVDSAKRQGRRTVAEDAVIALHGIELEEVADVISNHKTALKNVVDAMNVEHMYKVHETKYQLRARINTPPKPEERDPKISSSQSSRNTLSSSNCLQIPYPNAIRPVPPPRCVSAPPLQRRKCRVKSSQPTAWSITPQKSITKNEKGARFQEQKPCAQISPMNPSTAPWLDRPYGIDVLSDGTRVVVEPERVSFLDKESGDVIRNVILYSNHDEAKVTACFDVTVLPNDDVIITDSHRKVLLLLGADSNEPEIFLEVKDMLPKGITNDGKILYVCDAKQGCVQKVDIATKERHGPLSLQTGNNDSKVSNGLSPHPCNVAINSQGELLVTDSLNSRLYYIDRDSSVRELTKGKGARYSRPTGVSWLDETQFVVAVQDTKCHHLVCADVAGDFMTLFGGRGRGDHEFESPQGLIVSEGSVLVC